MKEKKDKKEGTPAEEKPTQKKPTQQQPPQEEPVQEQPPQEEPAQESVREADEKEAALQEALALAEDYKRKWYSVTAEYENNRKRTQSQSAQRYLDGRADVVKGLLPIADNLERAVGVCKDKQTKKGLELVLRAFEKLLADEEILVIDPVGEPFDAEKHEAIMAVDPEEGEESGTVKQVYLKGYEQNGKILRFAQVVVIK